MPIDFKLSKPDISSLFEKYKLIKKKKKKKLSFIENKQEKKRLLWKRKQECIFPFIKDERNSILYFSGPVKQKIVYSFSYFGYKEDQFALDGQTFQIMESRIHAITNGKTFDKERGIHFLL